MREYVTCTYSGDKNAKIINFRAYLGAGGIVVLFISGTREREKRRETKRDGARDTWGREGGGGETELCSVI